MKKKNRTLFVVFGVGLIVLSLCIATVFALRAYKGERDGRKVVSQILALLPERTKGAAQLAGDLPVLEIDGKDYVGLLDVPAFGLTLPVADAWDKEALSAAPARFAGNLHQGPFVIGGVDAAYQFGFCDKIENGAVITFTDMTGTVFTYTVSRVDRAKEPALQWLQEQGCDLTLFCRDTYSLAYVAVRCTLSYK